MRGVRLSKTAARFPAGSFKAVENTSLFDISASRGARRSMRRSGLAKSSRLQTCLPCAHLYAEFWMRLGRNVRQCIFDERNKRLCRHFSRGSMQRERRQRCSRLIDVAVSKVTESYSSRYATFESLI